MWNKRKLKRNEKGMSLIEVVVSLAIMSIIVVMVFQFVQIGLNTSTNASKTANVQKEAQTTINQLKDWIMETNRGIVCYKGTGDYDSVAAIYNKDRNATGSYDSYVQLIYYRNKDQALYYDKVIIDADFTGNEADIAGHGNKILSEKEKGRYLFSKYVSSFSLDTSMEKEQKVNVSIFYENSGKTYEVSNVVKMRNVPVNDPADYSK